MAARLTVIMVHSPPANAAAQKIAESVVGEIIGRPGIDLTLVGPLKQIAQQSTDRLTLESITGDVAALDWRAPQELVDTLNGIGFAGTRSAHPDDLDATSVSPGKRRIYAFDLQKCTDAKQLCTSLNALLSQRQVRTFTLGQSLNKSQLQSAAQESTGVTGDVTTPHTDNGESTPPKNPPSKTQPSESGSAVKSEAARPAANQPPVVSGPPAKSDTVIDLDDLVDKLDLLDL